MPHGRIYNALECIADWTEWTGAQLHKKLIERPAQLLKIRDINHFVRIICILGLMLLLILMLVGEFGKKLWPMEIIYLIYSFNLLFAILSILFGIAFVASYMAQFIRYVNHWLFPQRIVIL